MRRKFDKAAAEKGIVAEMRRRLPSFPYRGADGGRSEYLLLKRDRPDLFDFEHPGRGEWALVSSWLWRHGVVD